MPAAELDPGHFARSIEEALDELIEARQGEPAAPVAVFDADGTLWSHDVGESFFRWLVDQGKLVGAAAEGDPWGAYEALCQTDAGAAYGSLGPKMAGLAEADVCAWARAHFEAHYLDRIYPAQRQLITRLQMVGWEVWICSASVRWLVEVGAEHLGVPPAQVIGIAVEVREGVLGDRPILPVTYREGKAEAIRQRIGRRPLLASGNSMTDFEMLEHAQALRLVINPGAELTQAAEDRGWMVQRWAPSL